MRGGQKDAAVWACVGGAVAGMLLAGACPKKPTSRVQLAAPPAARQGAGRGLSGCSPAFADLAQRRGLLERERLHPEADAALGGIKGIVAGVRRLGWEPRSLALAAGAGRPPGWPGRPACYCLRM